MIRTYAVTYHIAGQTKIHTTWCVTSPVLKTMFKDIPKMIAIKRGVSEDQIMIAEVSLLNVEDVQPAPVVINIHGANHGAIQM